MLLNSLVKITVAAEVEPVMLKLALKCEVPENLHPCPKQGCWKFHRGRVSHEESFYNKVRSKTGICRGKKFKPKLLTSEECGYFLEQLNGLQDSKLSVHFFFRWKVPN